MTTAAEINLEVNAMTENTMTTTPVKERTTETPATREDGRYLAPPVDIYENGDGLVVVVDLPGVNREDVKVGIDENILSIRATNRYTVPADALHREFSLTNWHREFRLTDKVDQARIGAELKHGVLTLTLPKAEKLQPREVEVVVGA